jgi:hypothetical protein
MPTELEHVAHLNLLNYLRENGITFTPRFTLSHPFAHKSIASLAPQHTLHLLTYSSWFSRSSSKHKTSGSLLQPNATHWVHPADIFDVPISSLSSLSTAAPSLFPGSLARLRNHHAQYCANAEKWEKSEICEGALLPSGAGVQSSLQFKAYLAINDLRTIEKKEREESDTLGGEYVLVENIRGDVGNMAGEHQENTDGGGEAVLSLWDMIEECYGK